MSVLTDIDKVLSDHANAVARLVQLVSRLESVFEAALEPEPAAPTAGVIPPPESPSEPAPALSTPEAPAEPAEATAPAEMPWNDS